MKIPSVTSQTSGMPLDLIGFDWICLTTTHVLQDISAVLVCHGRIVATIMIWVVWPRGVCYVFEVVLPLSMAMSLGQRLAPSS